MSQIIIDNGEIDSLDNFTFTTSTSIEETSKWTIQDNQIECVMENYSNDTTAVMVWVIDSSFIEEGSKMYHVQNLSGSEFGIVFSKKDHAVKILNRQNNKWSIMSGKGLDYSKIN
jgi:hypothetical protein